MAYDSYLQFALALLLVLGLIAILAWLLRRFGMGGALRPGGQRRVQVIETSAVGPRHRLVLVRRDRIEHLLLLGPQGDVVVERGIDRTAFDQEMARKSAANLVPPRDALRQEPPALRSATDATHPVKDGRTS